MSAAPDLAEEPLVKAQTSGPEVNSEETATRPDFARGQIARAAALVLFAFIISNIVGLGHQLVTSQLFGTSEVLDSFNAANRLTELLFNLIAGGLWVQRSSPCSLVCSPARTCKAPGSWPAA